MPLFEGDERESVPEAGAGQTHAGQTQSTMERILRPKPKRSSVASPLISTEKIAGTLIHEWTKQLKKELWRG